MSKLKCPFRSHSLLGKNPSARGGPPPKELLVREAPGRRQAIATAVGYNITRWQNHLLIKTSHAHASTIGHRETEQSPLAGPGAEGAIYHPLQCLGKLQMMGREKYQSWRKRWSVVCAFSGCGTALPNS